MPVHFLNIFVGKEVENFLCFFNEVKYYLCYKLYTFGLKIKRYYIYEYCLHITLCRKIIFKKMCIPFEITFKVNPDTKMNVKYNIKYYA